MSTPRIILIGIAVMLVILLFKLVKGNDVTGLYQQLTEIIPEPILVGMCVWGVIITSILVP